MENIQIKYWFKIVIQLQQYLNNTKVSIADWGFVDI